MVKKIYVKKICELEVNEETSDGNFILVLITTKKSRYLRTLGYQRLNVTLHKKKKVFKIWGAVRVNLEACIKTLGAWYCALLSLYARLLNGWLTMKINVRCYES